MACAALERAPPEGGRWRFERMKSPKLKYLILALVAGAIVAADLMAY